jgi:hypothetical protein
MEQAMPAKPTRPPEKPRKILVFNLCNGFKHSSIPYWDKALEIMGKKTGAFQVEISNDMSAFDAENLAKFDAVCLNNTTGLKFSQSQRESLMNFVKGGKGIIGVHAATDNFYDWPDAAKMMGGQFSGHPWGGGGTWAIKIDEPSHPLTAAFKGKGFKVKDEIYRTAAPFYSRAEQLVLMPLANRPRSPAMQIRALPGSRPLKKDGCSIARWVTTTTLPGTLRYCSIIWTAFNSPWAIIKLIRNQRPPLRGRAHLLLFLERGQKWMNYLRKSRLMIGVRAACR